MGVLGRAMSREKQKQQQQVPRHPFGQRPGNNHLQNSIDGFEASLSGSSEQHSYESGSETNIIQNNSLHQRQFLNSDGQISLLPNTSRLITDRAHEPTYLKQNSDLSLSSTSGLNSLEAKHQPIIRSMSGYLHDGIHNENRMKLEQQKRSQHRQLQESVHQQLQKIYGDRQASNQNRTSMGESSASSNGGRQQMIHCQQGEQYQQRKSFQHNHPQDEFHSQRRYSTSDSSRIQYYQPDLQQHQQNSSLISNSDNQRTKLKQTYDVIGQVSSSNKRQSGAFIGAIPEETDSERDASNDEDSLMPHSLDPMASRKSIVARKSQLENLHYATITAAALLDATANAAAAIAATDKQFKPRNGSTESIRMKDISPPNQNHQDYSNPYQEIKRVYCQHNQDLREQQSNPMYCKHHQEQWKQMVGHQRVPIYADATGSEPVPVKSFVGLVPTKSVAHVNHMKRAEQLQATNNIKNNHYYNVMNGGRLMPARKIDAPPVGIMMDSVMRHLDPRIVQQARILHAPPPAQQTAAVPTALAIVHTGGGKNASMRADLIGRMLINNMITAQRMAIDSHYSINGNLRVASQRPEPLLASGRDKINSNQPIFRMPATRASSDSSGHSSAPLMMNRDIAPVSFIERICRIDLTFFWWCLLIISLIFVSLIIAISRYLFQ